MEGNLVFVADGRPGFAGGGLNVFDISDPANPVEVGQWTGGLIGVVDVVVVGSLAYVAVETNGLRVLDVSDPSNITVVGSFPMASALDINLEGTMGFIATDSGFSMIDLSAPSSPTLLSAFVNEPTARTFEVVSSGDSAFQGTSWGISSIDVTVPSSPTLRDQYFLPEAVYGLTLLGQTLFVASRGLLVYDVSNPAKPLQIGAAPDGDNFNGLGIRGNSAFCITSGAELRAYDISDPTSPVFAGSLGLSSEPRDIGIDGSYAYISETGGVSIVDIAAPSSPTLIRQFNIPGAARQIVFQDGLAYVAASNAGLQIIDISDPLNPAVIGAFDPDDIATGTVARVSVEGTVAYIADSSVAIRALDVSNPANPIEIGFLPTGHQLVFVQDELGYIGSDASFHVVDVRNPASLSVIATATPILIPSAESFVRVGNSAFFGSDLGIGVVVIAVPPPPPVVNQLDTFINADVFTLTGTVAPGSFVTVGGGGAPFFQQLRQGETAFSIQIDLREESLNTLSVTTMNEFGLVSLPSIVRVVEGNVYPDTLESVSSLAIAPSPAPAVALNGSAPFTATATFSDASSAEVTEFVTWEVSPKGELITPGGLYVNTKPGSAQIRAFVSGAFSNSVVVPDAP